MKKIQRLCRGATEATLMRACVANFAPSSARERYAEWLAARKDKKRAEVVRATVTAYESLDGGVLEKIKRDAWNDMLGVEALKRLSAAKTTHPLKALKKLRDQLFPRFRPALELRMVPTRSKPKVGESHWWGLPDFGPKDHWPTIGELSNFFRVRRKLPQAHPAAFVAQLAFRDLAGTLLAFDLPSTGWSDWD